ncbi:MAG TPA: hypothetical protein VN887_16030 [Candidatus Angelobacter sp.]|nr:hypothetical protein [Candidatus Angelobacter sp.]
MLQRLRRTAELRRFRIHEAGAGLLALCAASVSLHAGVLFTDLVSFGGTNASITVSEPVNSENQRFYRLTLPP